MTHQLVPSDLEQNGDHPLGPMHNSGGGVLRIDLF
jgi:hypothetical protein